VIYTSELITNVATNNIDLAIEGLICLNNSEPTNNSPNEKRIEWAHYLCTYARYVHLNTWADCEPIERVADEFVPELEKSERLIARLLERRKELRFTKSQIHKLKRYKKNVTMRKNKLVRNYCGGL